MVVEKNIEKEGVLCETCENSVICKFASDMQNLSGKINGLKLQFHEKPFRYDITCDCFRKKARKEDGFNAR